MKVNLMSTKHVWIEVNKNSPKGQECLQKVVGKVSMDKTSAKKHPAELGVRLQLKNFNFFQINV